MDTTDLYKAVGHPIPPGNHSVVVCLPTWRDTLGYRRGESHTVDRMQTGYPRLFMPPFNRKLAEQLEKLFALPSERSLLVRSALAAEACRAFITAKAGAVVHVKALQPLDARQGSDIFMVIFPSTAMPTALAFWQHTGFGISGRFAEQYISFLFFSGLRKPLVPASDEIQPLQVRNKRQRITQDANSPKSILRDRIVKLITHSIDCAVHRGPKSSLLPVASSDVFLYPTGVTAMWSAHQLLLSVLGTRKSVCFGFPYTDTLKILEKWGPGCHFYPDGDQADLNRLEAILMSQRSPSQPPILALFTEFPSNPLLRSVDLHRLRALADQYEFPIVIDDTIGNFVNVDVLPYADIVVSSLTKIFSGCANVMGGSLVLNPLSKYHAILKNALERNWEDIYFEEDAVVMELNSRTFCERIVQIDKNAGAICDFLRSRTDIIAQVHYPKWQTHELYDAYRSKFTSGEGGFGGLFSLVFVSPRAAHAFFDALECAKGPSLGTNFTLSCPYTLYGHFTELEWAAKHGVPEDLVRVSVGIEDTMKLLDVFAVAVRAAELNDSSNNHTSSAEFGRHASSCS
ncbi:uncharacterized protein PHACADRAFT_88834 [Phanerochaete carnosa HHB-10118-sp]|uniref:Cystathionine gamma-synthase n=1 Tax=Phanerochaete carnosa (strain HHB-10118-sp) TaxID=650164 RepID=K5V4L6_PHACS|nr:uncharacterized protein PHACADRAFT_88834 [Phanerochaete carnosa HHB-10118-sp]EKM57566.1 hypothetical protein PHACADRAFT_88834 [Phanerochaete carnosa HHB-10118-sp]